MLLRNLKYFHMFISYLFFFLCDFPHFFLLVLVFFLLIYRNYLELRILCCHMCCKYFSQLKKISYINLFLYLKNIKIFTFSFQYSNKLYQVRILIHLELFLKVKCETGMKHNFLLNSYLTVPKPFIERTVFFCFPH